MIHKPAKAFPLLLAGVLALASGCATEPLSKIAKDDASASRAKGVLVYRIHLATKTAKPQGSPYLILDKVGERLGVEPGANQERSSSLYANNVAKSDFWSGKALQSAWKAEGETLGFDDLVFAEAEPGLYHIREVYQPIDSYSYTSGTTTTTVTHWLDIKVDYAFSIKAGQGLDLGTIEVSLENAKDGRFNYGYSIDYDPAKAAETAAAFKREFPGLALGLAEPLARAGLFWYQDLQQKTSQVAPVDYVHKKASDGKLEARATLWGPALPSGLPFSVEWTAMWKEGSLDQPFGVYLGHDSNDAFLIGVTEGRRAIVSRLVNGDKGSPLLDVEAPSVRLGRERLRNAFRLDVADGRGRFFVNGTQVGEFPCESDFSRGIFGYFALGQGIIDFGSPRLVELRR